VSVLSPDDFDLLFAASLLLPEASFHSSLYITAATAKPASLPGFIA